MDSAWLLVIVPLFVALALGGLLKWLSGKEVVDVSNEQENRD